MKNTLIILLLSLIITSCSRDSVTISNTEENEVINPNFVLTSPITHDTNLPPRTGHEMIFFNNYYWFMGGVRAKFGGNTEGPYNDIWRSQDGINWVRVVENAPWTARTNFNLFEFNNKLWIMGTGIKLAPSEFYVDDIWNSDDGINWTLVTDNPPWSTRFGSAVHVFNNEVYLIGGHTETNWHLNQDVWKSSDGISWQNISEISDATLGNPQTRDGIYEHDIISINNKLLLFGGQRSSALRHFDWVLQSTDSGINWSSATQTPPWGEDRILGPNMSYIRPFTYKNKVFTYLQLRRNPRTIDLNGLPVTAYDYFYELHSTTDGIMWNLETEIPIFNNRSLKTPRTVAANNRILMFGSYEVATNLDDRIHVIELFEE